MAKSVYINMLCMDATGCIYIIRMTKEEKTLLEIKTNESEAAAKIIVVGVGGGGNNAYVGAAQECI